jgi:hypothetical protein
VPLLIALAVILIVVALVLLAIPLSLVHRYHAGTRRRPARGWVSTINLVSLALSATLLLAGAAITNIWVPRSFLYSLGGLAGGALLGIVGLAMTRWEITPWSIHYTPSRLLVASIIVLVTARLIFGFWRSWTLWQAEQGEFAWVAASGAAASIGAGAIVVGYYLLYFAGVRRRVRMHADLTRLGRPSGR